MTAGPSPRVRRVNERGAIRYHGPSDSCAVYRIYNSAGDLLYVGMSYEPDDRVRVQRREKPWGNEIDHHEAEWHPDRETAKRIEAQVIKELQPRHNVTYTPDHRVRSLRHLNRARAQQIAEGRSTGKRAKATEQEQPEAP